MNSICLISMPFFLNLYFQAPKYPLAHVSMQIRTKPRTPSLMAWNGIWGFPIIITPQAPIREAPAAVRLDP